MGFLQPYSSSTRKYFAFLLLELLFRDAVSSPSLENVTGSTGMGFDGETDGRTLRVGWEIQNCVRKAALGTLRQGNRRRASFWLICNPRTFYTTNSNQLPTRQPRWISLESALAFAWHLPLQVSRNICIWVTWSSDSWSWSIARSSNSHWPTVHWQYRTTMMPSSFISTAPHVPL